MGEDSGLERERESGNIGGKIAKARRLRRTQIGKQPIIVSERALFSLIGPLLLQVLGS